MVGETEAGERLDKILAHRFADQTRTTIQRWIETGRVSVDGAGCRSKDRLRRGAVIALVPDLPPRTEALPDGSVLFDVVHEDEALLVVNKPPGLVVHPARGHYRGTLVNGLLARPGFERVGSDPRDPDGQLRPGIVHRIDKDTSGLLVVAKTEPAREHLKAQLAGHHMKRTYVALTVGTPQMSRIATFHGRDPHHRLRFSSKVTEGRRAVTHLVVVERLAGGRAALVECRLETGRTHQIRVHLSLETRTPLLGDDLYGGLRGAPEIAQVARQLGRQALHAKTLGFVHPTTGREMTFSVEPPADFSAAYLALRQISAS